MNVENAGGALTVAKLTGEELARWRERGRDAAKFRVTLKRAVRDAAPPSAVRLFVVGPAGEPVEQLRTRLEIRLAHEAIGVRKLPRPGDRWEG